MKHSTFMKTFALLALAFTGEMAYSQSNISLRKIKAVKPGVQVNMLDSVTSENYRKIYQYNEYGYITSVMVYHKDTDWSLVTGQSYLQDYVFNADGQCIERTRYHVDENGKRTVVDDMGRLEVKDDLTWEYTYSHNDDGKLHPETAKAYDQWGNLTIDIEYETDWYSYEDYISSYEENRYSGPVYSEHFKENSFKDTYRTFHLIASQSDGLRTMNADELSVSYCEMNLWEHIDGNLYRKHFCGEDLSEATVGTVKKYLKLASEDIYELNAAGTRPVNMTSVDMSDSDYHRYTAYYEYTWDDKDRLLSESYSHSVGGDVESKYTYTYADDYTPEKSLMDAVYAIRNNVGLYPEDEFCTFGRLATVCSDHTNEETDNASYTWNDKGQMVLNRWKETGTWYEYETQTYHQYEDNGEEYYYYNTDGHMSHMIGIDHEDGATEYFKIEYIYELGMWTGEKEYSGDSFDGPWYAEYSESKARTRKSALKSASFFDDMSDGYHDIYDNDGVFITQGNYFVEDGKIVNGYYFQYFYNTASIPENPELNYTEPEVPFEIMNDDAVSVAAVDWHYRWNNESEEWVCVRAYDNVTHRYYNGDDIVCDIYNRDKQITGTITYSFDEDGRLAKQSSENSEIVYTYLSDGSDYLFETVTTQNGVSSVLHYYYSLHNYVLPSGIDEIEGTTAGPVYYDMQGRCVKNPPVHGIYIVNGKKVMK